MITPKPRVTSIGKDQAIALIGQVMVVVVHWEPGPDWPPESARLVTEIRRRYAGRGACLVIIKEDIPPPGEASRQRIVEAMRDWQRGLICGGFVFETSGFVAAAQRSALSMMLMMARLPIPVKVFSSMREATGFVCGMLGTAAELDPDGLARAIEDLRSAYAKGELELDI